MKIHIGEAVTALGIEDFILDGEPTNETEFNSSFKKIVGAKGDEAVMSVSYTHLTLPTILRV